ncbi:murein biosynthesis integral membrane protein MurJ [Rhodovulum adriaticum]|uniref:Probable lipid II flippase MurJ n=1 Tax=Rhodovulum adriaticum TaxID=35804 RepID=A0A4R2NYB9_RHOAD|nr:murein biosynthesis integral membrane protein MurJ [Rhodovulum adriaticum]MBK1636215.1 murein biosynthesis integral membrane protein MurJ [Rhodovulum adriaticum]TCP26531.1 putative peptidoglycan lipid II flippase [Rhodovulum adriaticum]
MQPIRLLSGLLTVGGWTMVSRVLGFVRDILIAAWLGTGPAHQAFVVAFSLPNLFRRFFAEGAFNMAFVPMFSKRLEAGEDAQSFARDAFSALGGLLILFTLAAQAAMPWLVLAMASGFRGQEQFDLAVFYGRIAFPYILFISLAALLSGVLNAAGRFAAAAAAPVLLNVLFIAAMAGAATLGGDVALALIWAVPVAGVAQMALVWWAAKEAGFRITPHLPRLTPELRRLAIIAAPAALAGGVVQVNLLIGRQVASYFDSAVSWLYNADRLYQLPLGVVAIAIGVVLLPDLSRRLRADDPEGSHDSFSRAAEFSLILTLPAAVALVAIPLPLVSVLFERGAFGSADSAATALAVAVYGAGLPAFVMQKVLQPLFFAREDTRRPFYYALAAMVVNAAVAIGLAPVVGYIAAAWGTTLAAWAMVALLWRGSRGMGLPARLDDRFHRRLPRIVLASGLMGAVLYGAGWALAPWLTMATVRYGALALLIGLGIVSYFGAGHLLGAFCWSEFRRAMRRQR